MEEKDEQVLVQQKYEELLETCRATQQLSEEDEANIFRAFTIARTSHGDTRRKSGELYIFHPLAVALIAVREVGLGPIAVVCALLHDVVEDTDVTIEEIEAIFGERAARIVDGVTKIDKASMIVQGEAARLHGGSEEGIVMEFSSQAENYRKILLAMCNDAYVIFLKLCDRLHNMRTLQSMKDTKKLAISSETQYLYIPLAHRLGLYSIKTELEDLVMQYTNPDKYAELAKQINTTAGTELRLKDCFSNPIRCMLKEHQFLYTIKTRVKSVYSCWKKMQNKGVTFDEIYDLYAMRIILDLPTDPNRSAEESLRMEREECFKVYALVTGMFSPLPSRFRDWISNPKNNGYESLHTTVMSPIGRWVEVQIRTTRMDRNAEKGMAAHFLYKEAHPDEPVQQSPVEEWLQQIRTSLENSQRSALDLVEEFKETLYTKEIYLFTPKGETIKLPSRSTVLDFAYAIHAELGTHCMGAKVNARVVSIGYKLHSGEQVQILTSQKAVPNEEWLTVAQTSRAKESIKSYLREMKKGYREAGEKRLGEWLQPMSLQVTPSVLGQLRRYFNVASNLDLFYRVAIGDITEKQLRQCYNMEKGTPVFIALKPFQQMFDDTPQSGDSEDKDLFKTATSPFLIDTDYASLECAPAPCCKPVQGDKVVGIVADGKIVVHRTTCPSALHEMSTHEDHIVRARWRPGEKVSFLTGISLTAIDRKGLLQELTRIISDNLNLNMRAITLEASEGVARGLIMLYVYNIKDLDQLMQRLRAVEGVESVQRV